MHGLDGGPALFDEDASSVAGVTPQGGRFWFVFVDGKSHSVLPYGDDEHTLLGAVPAVIHPAPVDAAIVGLGSGNTAWAAGCRSETQAYPGVRDRLAAGPSPARAGPASGLPPPPRVSRGSPRTRSRPRTDATPSQLDETPLRSHRGRRPVAVERLQREPLLDRVLRPLRPPPEAGRCRLHLGPHAPHRPDLRAGLPPGGGRRRDPRREPRPAAPRRGGVDRAGELAGGARLPRPPRRPRPAEGPPRGPPPRPQRGASINRDLNPRDEFATP